MHRVRLHRRALLVAVSLLLASAAPAAELAPWDQERATQLAVELADVAKQIRQAFRKQPQEVTAVQERARGEYLETLRALEKATKQLASRLQAGQGRDETLPVARKIRSLLNDAETTARKFMETAQMRELYEPADRLLAELGPYYFAPEGDAAEG